jgi:hypothetical protein
MLTSVDYQDRMRLKEDISRLDVEIRRLEYELRARAKITSHFSGHVRQR